MTACRFFKKDVGDDVDGFTQIQSQRQLLLLHLRVSFNETQRKIFHYTHLKFWVVKHVSHIGINVHHNTKIAADFEIHCKSTTILGESQKFVTLQTPELWEQIFQYRVPVGELVAAKRNYFAFKEVGTTFVGAIVNEIITAIEILMVR